jgi:hypothetical protein
MVGDRHAKCKTYTSEKSKEESRKALKELGGEDAFYGKQSKGE